MTWMYKSKCGDVAILSKDRYHWNYIECGECGHRTSMPCRYCKRCGRKLDRNELAEAIY